MRHIDLAVIGGGPAGMAAAIEAKKYGIKDVVIIDRGDDLGGILQQCIHNGFGLHFFKEELTGPEYAWRFIEKVRETGIEVKTCTTVLDIGADKTITAVNGTDGLIKLRAKAVILTMGCRERTRGALNIPGARPAGIYTAGTAQKFVNIYGYLPGKKVVILGSGDIGLIMARRMTLEGARVKMVCEVLPYPGGLTRNIVQCLNDFDIPLLLGHTVINIHGKERLEGVSIAEVDKNRKPIMETADYVECDTLLLSVGLIPENELSRGAGIALDPATSGPVVNESMETSISGIFACGNVLQVHDLADNVTMEAMLAGRCAARHIQEGDTNDHIGTVKTVAGEGIQYIVPQIIRKSLVMEGSCLFFRVNGVFRNTKLILKCGNKTIYECRKKRMVPGEMESIRLTRGILDMIGQGDDILVQLANI